MTAFNGEVAELMTRIRTKFIRNHTNHLNQDPQPLTADQLQEISNLKSARRIASFVTSTGEQKFGPGSWSEARLVLPDVGDAYLQSSATALVITIPDSENVPYETHVHFDLSGKETAAYERTLLGTKQVVNYRIYLPEKGVPASPSSSKDLHDVGQILTRIEQAGNIIYLLNHPSQTS